MQPTRQNSRNPADLHPRLVEIFNAAAGRWREQHPARPQPKLAQTYRGAKEQAAFFAQGRRPLADVNTLRAAADNLPPINEAANKKKVTNATFSRSAHNYLPARAFDIYFLTARGTVDYEWSLFADFWKLVQKVAPGEVEWLGTSASFKEGPHYQLKNWSSLT